MWPPGASGGWGGRGPRSAMRLPFTFGHAASDPEGNLCGGHFRCHSRPLLKGRAKPEPRRLPSPPPAAGHPSTCPLTEQPPPPPHVAARRSVLNGPGTPCPSGPIWPPALVPAWPPGGLSRVAASRLAVPRPASLQRHLAGPNRHPARQPGRAATPLRTRRHLPTESRAAAAAAPLCPLPDPLAVPSLLPAPQAKIPRTRALPALTSRERTDPTPSAAASPTAASEPAATAAAAAAASTAAAAAAAHCS